MQPVQDKAAVYQGAAVQAVRETLAGGTTAYCRDCTRHKHVFDYGYALYDYQSMKKSIYRFKYGRRCEYAAFYARDICERLSEEIRVMGADSIVPVPVHASRRRSRGYNQAELVASEMSRLTGITMYDKLVKKSPENGSSKRAKYTRKTK